MSLVATGSRLQGASPEIGVMIGPRTRGLAPLQEGRWWASDNDSLHGRFHEPAFLHHLARLQPFAPRCLFVAAPDVPGNAAATLALFPRWRHVIEEHDFPAALIAQAHRLGYWGVHVGRVNSARRMRGCAALGADSCDGTSLRYVGVERGLRDVERWVRASNHQAGLFDLRAAS